MAQKRASLASHALEDLHEPLTSIRDAADAVAASEGDQLPVPSNKVREFIVQPLGDPVFPSVVKPAAKDRLVPFPIRLRLSQVERLEALRRDHGIVPSELVRDFIDECLPKVKI